MKKFKTVSAIDRYVNKRDRSITVMDFNHHTTCTIIHADKSKFIVTNPLIETVLLELTNMFISENVYIIYSEHHKPFVYMESDLKEIPKMQFIATYIIKT